MDHPRSNMTGTNGVKPRDEKNGEEKPMEYSSVVPACPIGIGCSATGDRAGIVDKGDFVRYKLSVGGRTMVAPSDSDGLDVFASHGDKSPEQADERLERMLTAVKTLLECMGEDPDRDGLLATPLRCAKSLLFLTHGYKVNLEDVVNNAVFQEECDGMVLVKDIDICSMCEHHLLPFTGKMHIGYIPNGKVIGLSKLPRIAEVFSRRLQIQERLTKQVAHAIKDIINPQGVAVVMESCHLCMTVRGVQKTSTTTITSCMLDCFELQPKLREEFLSLVSVKKT